MTAQSIVRRFCMFNPSLVRQLDALAHEATERLKALAPPELVFQPSYADRQVSTESGTIVLATIHDILPDGDNRFVVQVGRKTKLALYGYVGVNGIALLRDGVVRNLTDDELAVFRKSFVIPPNKYLPR